MSEKNFQKNLGKGMHLLACIILLGLLTLYFSKYLDKQKNPNQNLNFKHSDNHREVQLQRNRYGHYVASGMINDKPVIFIVDTGATNISIPEHIANRLGLQRGHKTRVYTANGQIDVYTSRLEKVNLGGIELHNIKANINPFMAREEILLGMSFFKHLDFSQTGDQLLIQQY